MEKMLQLCEMFRCDMDTLIRGDAAESFAEDNAHVLLFVVYGLKDEEFRRKYPKIGNVYTS